MDTYICNLMLFNSLTKYHQNERKYWNRKYLSSYINSIQHFNFKKLKSLNNFLSSLDYKNKERKLDSILDYLRMHACASNIYLPFIYTSE